MIKGAHKYYPLPGRLHCCSRHSETEEEGFKLYEAIALIKDDIIQWQMAPGFYWQVSNKVRYIYV